MKRKMNKGITLIALVITIIVLLILAGISLATLTGQNGVLTKANSAKDEHKINQYKEEILIDSVTGLPKSKKGGNHGLGMQSILGFSEKIHGSLGCYLNNGIFDIVLFAKL